MVSQDPEGGEQGLAIEAGGITVRLERGVKVGSLRYFDACGGFTAGVADVLGGRIPAPLTAVRRVFGDGSDIVLAWRSPTETLMICPDDRRHAQIERQAAAQTDGCFVDQSGGILLLTVTGTRAAEMLSRLGSNLGVPQIGQAQTARFAELSVTALCIRPGEILLLVERVYIGHLLAWIRETLADFQEPKESGVWG